MSLVRVRGMNGDRGQRRGVKGRRYIWAVLESKRPFLRGLRGKGHSLQEARGGCWGGWIQRGAGMRQGVGQSTSGLGGSKGLGGLGSS